MELQGIRLNDWTGSLTECWDRTIAMEAACLLGQGGEIETRRWFYVLFMLGAVAVFVLLRWSTRSQRIDSVLPLWDRVLIGWGAFVGGAFGAKVPFVLFDPAGVFSLEAWVADGKTITTALMGGYLGVESVKALLRVKLKTGDGYALPLAAALSVGRLGCFFNRCCYGVSTSLPWGVDFGAGPAHPTQIYETCFHATCAFLLWRLPNWEWLRCQRLKLYLIAYCVYRFLTEWLRPEQEVFLGLTFYQLVTIAFAALLVVHWSLDESMKRKQRENRPHERHASTPSTFTENVDSGTQ